MTDKKLKVNNLAYTELSIKIATLDMKLDAILKLLNKPEQELVINQLVAHTHFDARDPEITKLVNKAIAESLNTSSDNEKINGEFK